MKRRYAILALHCFATEAKTAHGVIAYASDETVAVIDPDHAGKTVRDVLPHLGSDAPIVATFAEALGFQPNALLIGTAPKGGALPPDWRAPVLAAITAKLEIVSGLHDFLGDDAEFAAAALASGSTIWDVRKVPDSPIFSGAVYRVKPPVVLMVGNDCAVGKMTVALEIARAARKAGKKCAFVPTGQTGIMIAGWGVAIDRVIADFATGATEQLVLQAAHENPDLIVVEGQGAINNPAYAPVTLALMNGSGADALVLVVEVLRHTIGSFSTPTLAYRALISLHESLLATIKPAKVVGIALNTRGLSDVDAIIAVENARARTGLPVDDIVRNGPDDFYADIAERIEKTRPLAHEESSS